MLKKTQEYRRMPQKDFEEYIDRPKISPKNRKKRRKV